MSVTTACQTTSSVSALLKEARAALGVSRHAAAVQTKIPERYLELFETGEFAHAADDVYSRIYLKTYCTYLKL